MKLSNIKLVLIIFIIFILGLGFGLVINNNLIHGVIADNLSLDEQEATVRAIKKVIPSVVSVIVYDYKETISVNLDTGEQNINKVKEQMGSGTGFIISSDGLIITNKHVVNAGKEKSAEYRIILNSGKKYYAQLIDKDPISDIAVLKIFDKDLPYVELGNSDNLELGASVIAIGNSLGKYQNSATKGIVSGLDRIIIASDGAGNVENLVNTIQTDAEINQGNSGGPLIDLSGKVVGVNTAIDKEGAAIGFALSINNVRPVINSAKEVGHIVRPRLGVRFFMLTPEIVDEKKLLRDKGALISRGDNDEIAIMPDSPASKAGLAEGDIIFEINAIKIEGKNTLFSVIQKYKPGDRIGLKIQRGDKVIIRVVTLDKFK